MALPVVANLHKKLFGTLESSAATATAEYIPDLEDLVVADALREILGSAGGERNGGWAGDVRKQLQQLLEDGGNSSTAVLPI